MMDLDTTVIGADREKMAVIFSKRAAALAQRRARKRKTETGLLVLTFSLGEERYAVPLDALQEVQPFTDCVAVPKSDKLVRGIINVRGELHTVVDLPGLLGLELSQADDQGHVLLLKKNRIGFKVNQLEQILSCPLKDTTEEKSRAHGVPTQFTQAVLPDNTFLLSIEKILSHSIFSGKNI